MVNAQAEGQTSQDPPHIEWEDQALNNLLHTRKSWLRSKKEFWEPLELSESTMAAQIKERLAANDIEELDVGQTVECGDFIFTISRRTKQEETVIPPYDNMGITGIEST